jgi:ABC-2 type transport system ATP-binding protein
MDQPAVKVEGLRKRFGSVVALDGIDLEVPPGIVFALLGPNGAGKTTMVRILTTLVVPDGGRAEVAGFDVVRERARVRSVIGLAGQYAALDEHLTGRENLELISRLHHTRMARARERTSGLLEQFGLVGAGNRPVHTYSGGMRRRLDLAASLAPRPSVLFLDEPTTGLDPRTRAELWDEISLLVHEGTALVLTTQYLEEADRLANRIAMISAGRIVTQGTTEELKARAGADVLELTVSNPSQAAAAADTIAGANGCECSVDATSGRVNVPVEHGEEAMAQIVRRLDTAGIPVSALQVRHPTLDDVYLALTTEGGQTQEEGRHTSRAHHPSPQQRVGHDRTSLRWTLADTIAIARRDLRRYLRSPNRIVATALRPFLLLVVFNFVLGGTIHDEIPGGLDYLDYLLPGILVLAVVVSSIETGVGVAEEMAARVIDRFRALPMARSALVAGRAVSDVARNLVVITLLAAAGTLMGFRAHTNMIAVAAALLLVLGAGYTFSWVSAAIGLTVKDPEAVATLAFAWTYPFTFGSSIYVPVRTMPGWLQDFARVNPITHFADAVRALTVGGATARPVLLSLLWIAVILCVCVPYATRRYRLAE